jgi:sulfite exporter TauE/SafE
MSEIGTLILTAISIGFIHTVAGPDHYLPFVAISRARRWSSLKTLLVTILCGVGHVASSVVLGLIGVLAGTMVTKLEFLESVRGDFAAWVMIAFGLTYLAWGINRAVKKIPHKHHLDSSDGKRNTNITVWVLFIIFVLGPCEPLIPILMYPAFKSSVIGMLAVTFAFGLTTIMTMSLMVYFLSKGVNFIPQRRLERYSHALAGLVILTCGLAIKFGL